MKIPGLNSLLSKATLKLAVPAAKVGDLDDSTSLDVIQFCRKPTLARAKKSLIRDFYFDKN